MATYDYEVANLALVRLGANRITALTDASKNADELNAIFTLIRDEIMRDHPWGFATRYQTLSQVTENVLTVTGITKASPGVVTYTGTDPENGDCYLAENIVGMTEIEDIEFKIDSVDAALNTFKLYTMDGLALDTSAYVAVGTGGTFTRVLPPTANWGYVYELPSRILRVLEINDDPDESFEVIELRYLLSDTDECRAKFISTVSDVTRWDQSFVNLLAWRLAMEVALAITGDAEKARYASTMYGFWSARAKATDASEGRTEEQKDKRYLDARR